MVAVRKNDGLRRKAEAQCTPVDCPISYSDEVTKDQVRRIDELVKKEFEVGEWVTVERPA